MAQDGFKRKLTTIFSADVVGYSRLMEDNEEATIQTLNTYRNSMSTLIEQHSGRVVDMTGDNLMAEFSSVVDAVKCAVEAQKEMSERNAELPENRRMLFRIGVNLGDIVEEDDKIYGDGVNIAARLEGLAEAGGICISRTAYGQVKNKLNLGYEYLGEHSVKNISEPVHVYKVLMEADAAGKVIGEKRKTKRRMALAIALMLLIGVGGFTGWYLYIEQAKKITPASVENMAYPLPDKPSIAVLPFDNLSGDPEQEYFSDGLTEEIITGLSKLRSLFVIARNSSFIYKGKPVKIQQVSEELGVSYVLEGSVRKTENRVRITVQLIDAINGHHIWAERYDRDLKDIFVIQDEITMNIITALRVELTEGEQAAFRIKSATNLDAYLKYLQAREYVSMFERDPIIKARRLAEETIALAPNFEGGHSILAEVELVGIWLGLSKSPKDSCMRAIKLAKKAIAIEDSPEPHRILAGIYVLFRKHEEAIAEAKKALELDPNSANVHGVLGHVLWVADRPREAIPMIDKAIRLNPYPPSRYYHNLAWAYHCLAKYEEAIAAAKKAVHIQPNDIFARCALVSCYSLLGRDEEARAEASEVLRIDPNFSVARAERRSPLKNKEHEKKILDSYRRAGLK